MHRLTIELPESITAEEAKLELSAALYRAGRLTQGEAAEMAGLGRRAFLELLLKREEPVLNIDVQDLEDELTTWREVLSRRPQIRLTLRSEDESSIDLEVFKDAKPELPECR